jgi:hypothetical protein
MHFSVHLRAGLKQRLASLATEMATWEDAPRVDETEAERIRRVIRFFGHTTERPGLVVGGVDGSGDYPALSYGDSFVYVTVAHGTRYVSHPVSGLKEQPAESAEIVEFSWLPEDQTRRSRAIDEAFERIVGQPIVDVVTASDYRAIKDRMSRRLHSVDALVKDLIRPHAADAGNLAIQLRSTGELAAALRLIQSNDPPRHVLYDGTMSLPFVTRVNLSLFHEHLKRLCCVEARTRGVAFLAFSKSHGLPAIDVLERLAAEAAHGAPRPAAEHWFMRLPTQARDGWTLGFLESRNVPPPGAVSYLVRFHRNVPVMRLDADEAFWDQSIRGANEAETLVNEQRLFEDLDYVSHDQRAYGYPYPIKAGHDRASLTEAERTVLRKMIVDAAVEAGMNRGLFKNPSIATGHG